MKSVYKTGLLATALAIAPLSANAGWCGSYNKNYKKGHQGHQGYQGYPAMMHPGYYNQSYRMAPRPPVAPAPPAAPGYWQPQVKSGYNYGQPRHAMPMQAYPYAVGNLPAQPQMTLQTPDQPQASDKNSEAENNVQATAKDASASSPVQVAINGMQFQPATLKIKVGEEVMWNNASNMPHTVTSANGNELASPRMGNGGMFKHTFKEPGTYEYYCAIHPSMKGQVIVE